MRGREIEEREATESRISLNQSMTGDQMFKSQEIYITGLKDVIKYYKKLNSLRTLFIVFHIYQFEFFYA